MSVVAIMGQRGGSGGAALPSTIVAGDTVIYAPSETVIVTTNSTTYGDTGWAIKALQPGTYRFKYAASRMTAGISVKLQKNGVDVAGSEITSASSTVPSTGEFDVALAINDVVRVLAKSSSAGNYGAVSSFTVSILAVDLQGELNNIVTTP